MNDFNVTLYNQKLNTSWLGKDIKYFTSIDSTNNYASLLEKKAEHITEGMVIAAGQQTRGRGKLGAEWVSPPGGLYFTLILKPNLKPRNMPQITLLFAYAAARALQIRYGLKIIIKWPNDLYCCNRKLGGILVEPENIKDNLYVNLGMGLNVNLASKHLKPYEDTSTSISVQLGHSVHLETVLASILTQMEPMYSQFITNNDFAFWFKQIEKILIY